MGIRRESCTRGYGTGVRRVWVRGSQKRGPTGHPCPSLASSYYGLVQRSNDTTHHGNVITNAARTRSLPRSKRETEGDILFSSNQSPIPSLARNARRGGYLIQPPRRCQRKWDADGCCSSCWQRDRRATSN